MPWHHPHSIWLNSQWEFVLWLSVTCFGPQKFSYFCQIHKRNNNNNDINRSSWPLWKKLSRLLDKEAFVSRQGYRRREGGGSWVVRGDRHDWFCFTILAVMLCCEMWHRMAGPYSFVPKDILTSTMFLLRTEPDLFCEHCGNILTYGVSAWLGR